MSTVIEGVFTQSGQADQLVPLKVDSIGAMQINITTRACVGRQTISITTGTVVTLTVPTGAVAASIQADGSAVSITLDGTNPTSTVGSRIDDGMYYYVDTSLATVKLIARTATTNVQVVYFNKA
jgi:predicted dinucleotide-binding enzyme